MNAAKGITLAVRFLLELCALAAAAWWGSQVSSSTIVNVIVGVAAPIVLATVWGVWLAPRAANRLHPPARTVLELAVLAAAVAALVAVDQPVLALALAAAAILDGVLLHVWDLDRQVHGERARYASPPHGQGCSGRRHRTAAPTSCLPARGRAAPAQAQIHHVCARAEPARRLRLPVRSLNQSTRAASTRAPRLLLPPAPVGPRGWRA